jgi:hypothetical protein
MKFKIVMKSVYLFSAAVVLLAFGGERVSANVVDELVLDQGKTLVFRATKDNNTGKTTEVKLTVGERSPDARTFTAETADAALSQALEAYSSHGLSSYHHHEIHSDVMDALRDALEEGHYIQIQKDQFNENKMTILTWTNANLSPHQKDWLASGSSFNATMESILKRPEGSFEDREAIAMAELMNRQMASEHACRFLENDIFGAMKRLKGKMPSLVRFCVEAINKNPSKGILFHSDAESSESTEKESASHSYLAK